MYLLPHSDQNHISIKLIHSEKLYYLWGNNFQPILRNYFRNLGTWGLGGGWGLPAAPAVRSIAAWMAGLDFMVPPGSVEGNSLQCRLCTTYPWEEGKVELASAAPHSLSLLSYCTLTFERGKTVPKEAECIDTAKGSTSLPTPLTHQTFPEWKPRQQQRRNQSQMAQISPD